MKRIISFLFILISVKAAAQNYAPFKPGVMYVFLSPANTIWQRPPFFNIQSISHTIFCDTSYASGSDSVFLNYNHFASEPNCIKLNREFFFGKSMVKKSSGDYLLICHNNDTILIKPQVSVNDTFVYLREKEHPDSVYLAIVKSKQMETFDQTTDSVITYSIIRVNAFKQQIPSPSSGKELKISKQFGCIRWLFPGDSIEWRPTHCSDRIFGKPYPSVKQLNAFEVGDVFEYYVTNVPYSPVPGFYYHNPYERRKVLSKEISANNDTIRYKIEISTLYLNQNPRKIEYDTIETVVSEQDNDETWCLHNSFAKTFSNIGYESYFDISMDSLGFIMGIKKDLFGPTPPDSCYHPPLDGIDPEVYYRPGFGLVYSVTPDFVSERAKIKEMYYFKKGSMSLGTPTNFNLLLNQDNLPEEKHIFIYPNPVYDRVTIEWNEHKPAQFALYDLVGKEVLVFTLNQGKNELSLSSLPSGVYFYSVQSAAGITTQGKIIRK